MDINTVNEEMSLAEALQMRADIKTQIAQLRSRLNDNAKVQEGETPAEDPLRLIELLSAECEAYETLICRINLTNAATVFEGETLTALLARRDALSLELSIMRDFLRQASQRIDRYSKTEIKIFPPWTLRPCRKRWMRSRRSSGSLTRRYRSLTGPQRLYRRK